MASREIVTLNETTPQLEVPQSGDDYLVPRKLNCSEFVEVAANKDIIFNESADHGSTPGAAKGYIWLKNDAPNNLMFTDDAGTDFKLNRPPVTLLVAVSDETTALTTGTAKVTFRMPYAMTVTGVRASVTTAPTGAALQVDINEGGASILGTKLTIDATEKTSTTAAAAATITDAALADDAEMTIDIDIVGSTIAGAGLKVTLIGVAA